MSNSALQQPSKRDICITTSIIITATAAYVQLPSPPSTAYRAHINSSKNARESGSIKQERTLPAKRTANESNLLSIWINLVEINLKTYQEHQTGEISQRLLITRGEEAERMMRGLKGRVV